MIHVKVTKHPPTPYVEKVIINNVEKNTVVTDDLDLASYFDFLGWHISSILPEIDPARKGRHLLNFIIPDDIIDASVIWLQYYQNEVGIAPQPLQLFRHWRKIRTKIRKFTETQREV